MPTGTVKFYNRKYQFGFITVDDTSQEIYVNSKQLLDEISDNDRVEFEISEAKKGPVAIQVKKI